MTWNQAQHKAKQLRKKYPTAIPIRKVYGWCVEYRDKSNRLCTVQG
jgi:hypothetical protein